MFEQCQTTRTDGPRMPSVVRKMAAVAATSQKLCLETDRGCLVVTSSARELTDDVLPWKLESSDEPPKKYQSIHITEICIYTYIYIYIYRQIHIYLTKNLNTDVAFQNEY